MFNAILYIYNSIKAKLSAKEAESVSFDDYRFYCKADTNAIEDFSQKLNSFKFKPATKQRRLHLSISYADQRQPAKRSKPICYSGMRHPQYPAYRLIPRLHAWVREDEYYEANEFVKLQARFNRQTRKHSAVRSLSTVHLLATEGSTALRLVNVIPDENYRETAWQSPL